MPTVPKLSALVACYNSERTIEATLESLRWADEIVVLDSHSNDATLEICARHGARVLQYDCSNPDRKKNWGLERCRHEWVLILDSDETLEPGVEAEIRERLRRDDPALDGYRLARKNFVYGRWLRHGQLYPDFQLRLLRKGRGRYEDREVHARFLVQGGCGELEGHILHEGFKDLASWLPKLDHYASLECDELQKRGRRFSAARLTAYPLALFLKRTIWHGGLLDGSAGLMIAALDAFAYFVAYAKLYERERSAR